MRSQEPVNKLHGNRSVRNLIQSEDESRQGFGTLTPYRSTGSPKRGACDFQICDSHHCSNNATARFRHSCGRGFNKRFSPSWKPSGILFLERDSLPFFEEIPCGNNPTWDRVRGADVETQKHSRETSKHVSSQRAQHPDHVFQLHPGSKAFQKRW